MGSLRLGRLPGTRRGLVTAGALGCLAAGVAACGQPGAGAAAAPADSVTVTQRAAALKQTSCKDVAALPTWLPSAATSPIITCRSAGSPPPGGKPTDQSTMPVTARSVIMMETIYALKGVVNRSTIGSRNGHTSTTIDIVEYPRSDRISDSMIDSPTTAKYLSENDIRLASGATARITQARNGFGAVRIEWVLDGNSYLLISAHNRTHGQGVSGVPTADLIKIAASITR